MASRGGAFVLGGTAGAVGSMVGMGGSFFALPVLVNFFGISNPRQAVGTGISVAIGTAIGGTFGYVARDESLRNQFNDSVKRGEFPAQLGDVDVLTAAFVALGSSITVAFGARTTQFLNPRTLKLIIGSSLLVIGPIVPLNTKLRDWITSQHQTTQRQIQYTEKAVRSVSIGACSGFLAGLLGVGGGAIVVPALSLFTDLKYSTALGTSLAAMIPTLAIGGMAHYRQGTMITRLALPLGIGSCIGSFVGGMNSKAINEEKLKVGFAGVVSALGLQTLIQALRMAKH